MATWPATGDTDWNTKMLAYLAIGHDTDGTHNQEDWTPSTQAAAESITFPNGLIMKQGTVTVAANTTTVVTYGTAMPTATLRVSLTLTDATLAAVTGVHGAHTKIAAGFTAESGMDASHTFDWIVIGY